MAGPFYVDPAVGNDGNAGTAWGAGNAWATFQKAADTAVAGEVVYLKGTEVLSAQIDFDTNSGTTAGGWIKFIGCNSSGTVDGTRFVIDAGTNSVAIGMYFNVRSWIYFENIEVYGASSYGISGTGTSPKVIFNNLSLHDCGSHGINGYQFSDLILFRCAVYSNTNSGVYNMQSYHKYLFSSFHSNGGAGLMPAYCSGGLIFGCIISNNTNHGVSPAAGGSVILCCAIDDNGSDGIENGTGSWYYTVAIANRITKNAVYGIDGKSLFLVHGFNYFEDNTSGNYVDITKAIELLIQNVGTDVEDTPDTNEGYKSALTPGTLRTDYSTAEGATSRRTPITVPMS